MTDVKASKVEVELLSDREDDAHSVDAIEGSQEIFRVNETKTQVSNL